MNQADLSVEQIEVASPYTPSSTIKIQYVHAPYKTSGKQFPHIFFFVGFGEQRRESLIAAIYPFTVLGFSITSIALPFDSVSLHTAGWLLDEGLAPVLNKLSPAGKPTLLAGISRGAAIAAAVAGSEHLDHDGLVLASPLGLSKLSGIDYLARATKDHVVNKAFLDSEARKNGLAILKEMRSHHKSKDGLMNALRFAMNQQARVNKGILRTVDRNKIIAVFAGEKDLVFPYEDCRVALSKLVGERITDTILHGMPYGHAATASRAGQNQLKFMAQWIAGQY